MCELYWGPEQVDAPYTHSSPLFPRCTGDSSSPLTLHVSWKHCSWKASSVVLPLILWLCDITLRPHVKHLHKLCISVSLARRNLISTAARLLLALLAQACLCWPTRADWVFGRGDFKETGAKTDRGGIQSSSTGQYEKTELCTGH